MYSKSRITLLFLGLSFFTQDNSMILNVYLEKNFIYQRFYVCLLTLAYILNIFTPNGNAVTYGIFICIFRHLNVL